MTIQYKGKVYTSSTEMQVLCSSSSKEPFMILGDVGGKDINIDAYEASWLASMILYLTVQAEKEEIKNDKNVDW